MLAVRSNWCEPTSMMASTNNDISNISLGSDSGIGKSGKFLNWIKKLTMHNTQNTNILYWNAAKIANINMGIIQTIAKAEKPA